MNAPVDEEEMLDFSSGVDNAEAYKKKEDAARDIAYGRTKFLSLKEDGESVILRFLFEANQMGVDPSQPISDTNPHDPLTGFLLARQHFFVPTKPAPKDMPKDKEWPDAVGCVCRKTPVGASQKPAFPNCYVDDNIRDDDGKPIRSSLQMWASAVLREEVVGNQELVDEGRIHPSQIGQKMILDQGDWIDEVDEQGTTTGKKVWKRRYVVVNQAQSNFFSPLTSLADYWGTLLDRDYKITRKGAPKARRVEYTPVALAPYQVTVERNGQPATIGYDLREPEIAALYADSKLTRADLMKMISTRVSKKFYDKWFDTRVEISWEDVVGDFGDGGGKSKGGNKGGQKAKNDDAPPPPPPAQSPEQPSGQAQGSTTGPDDAAVKAMRERVSAVMGAAAPAAQQPAAQPETTQAAPVADPAPTEQQAAPEAAPQDAPPPPAAGAAPPMVGSPAPR